MVFEWVAAFVLGTWPLLVFAACLGLGLRVCK